MSVRGGAILYGWSGETSLRRCHLNKDLKIWASKPGRYRGEVRSKQREHKVQRCLPRFKVSKEASVGKAEAQGRGGLGEEIRESLESWGQVSVGVGDCQITWTL